MASAYGTKPSSLANPVPTGTNPFLEHMQPAPVSPLDSLETSAQQVLDSGVAQAQQILVPPTPTPVPTPAPQQTLNPFLELTRDEAPSDFDPSYSPNVIQQVQDAGIRAKASFAMTDKEKSGLLKQRYGDDNVRFVGGQFQVKRDGQKKFTKFDPDSFEILNDLLDFSREGTEAAITVPFEAAGATAGPAGIFFGRAVGGAAATNIADKIGEALGIEHDPSRSRALETSLSATINTVLPMIGDKLGASFAARKAAKAAAIPEHVLLSRESQAFEKEALALRDSGLIQNVPGTDTPFLLYQLHPDNPVARETAKELSALPVFRKAVQTQGEAYQDSVQNLLREAGNASGKKLVTDESLPKIVTNIAAETRKAEGKAIGQFKFKAQKNLEGAPQVISLDVKQTATDLLSRLGFKIESGGVAEARVPAKAKLIAPSPDEVVGKMGLSNEAAARDFTRVMGDFAKRIESGKMTLDQFDEAVVVLGDRVKNANRAGGEISAYYNRLVSQVRANRRTAIEAGLEGTDKQAFQKTMDRFGDILDAQDGLARSLDDTLSQDIFAKRIFNKGADGLQAIRSAKSLLAEEHPAVWDSMKGQWIEQLVQKHTSSGRTGFNSDLFLKDLNSYGTETLNEVFGADQTANLRKLLTFGKRLEKTDFSALKPQEQEEVLKKGFQFFSGFKSAKLNAALAFFRIGRGQNGAIIEQLSNEGINKFLERVPPKDKTRVYKAAENMIAWAKQNSVLTAARKGGAKVAQANTRIGAEKKFGGADSYVQPEQQEEQP